MNEIRPTDILIYYDGIQVFAGRDPIGGHYIGMMIDAVGDFDRYLVTGVVPERLRQFRSGLIDLRTLLLEAPGGEWFITVADTGYGEPLTLEPQSGPLLETGFLPEAGLLLDNAPIDDLALHQARERGNTVLEFKVEPPETADAHRVRANTLGGLLIHLQTLLRYAYHNSISELPRQTGDNLDTDDGHLVDVVVPAAPGFYRVILEAAKQPDMFGSGQLVRALRRMDEVFAAADNPDTARERLLEHKGHLAGAYIKLINFLSENRTGLWYSWADNLSSGSQYGGISEAKARQLSETLSGITPLTTEAVTLMGEFVRVNRRAGDWGLLTDDGIRRSGKVAEEGPSLNGLIIGKRYRFECLEDLEIDAAGREKHTLYLQKFEPA